MSDTKALEELNREVVKLVEELGAMNAKQDRLKELLRMRAELEQQMLGVALDAAPRTGARRRANGAERADEAAAVVTG
jgi:hypothetical protein